MRDVAIIGVGITKFGELWDKSFRNLISEAGTKAILDAGIEGKEIDALFVGSMSPGRFVGQEHVGALVADSSGLHVMNIPTTRVENACASGGLALRQAYISVASGMHDIVVVGGVEKMTDVIGGEATDILAMAADQEWEAFFGVTFPALYAMIARRHMHEYGTTREQLAEVAVKNHDNGLLNPNAHFRRKITVDSVLNATMVADPLTVLDCSPISDGAAALVLAPLDKAKQYTDKIVKISGSGQASDSLALHGREDICTFKATVEAARQAYKQAGVEPKDIDLAEVHDCFTIAEILAIEDLGFVKKGEGGKAAEEGRTRIDGDIPINPSGGLKAKGHPVGATGIAQAAEVTLQLRGEAGKRQVKDAEIGLTHNIGGSGATCVVHILEVV
ncbi:MAG: thiolase domain-containing protein [Thermoplasmata archaeon]|nr:MAG: thiolase domain-containing protein [Thermoplasmata archaeon]RLF51239.1 MAG: thiolase domain-containing protein [Thermoplasmata archaeon]